MNDAADQQPLPPHRLRRRLLFVLVLLLVLLALVLTPPLINVSRYQHRIATSMSQSLGRPVHLDNVSLHLLPMPGLTLQNLVVSEDPAFGNEPTIRANTVEATLRISSLWKRRVEFSSIRFVEPSVNLVRNAQGQWNLEEVLMHASHIDSAPTAQHKAGPTPRFPYIEATGGRINLKLGDEKTPFSLTETDFALWLPSPQVWRVRLEGKPARTDTNIGDPGTVRLEATLRRAPQLAEIPLDLHASWLDAPLGEASRLLTGDDRGWRGTLHFEAALKGPLSSAALHTKLTLDELRRADFVPAQPLDLSTTCDSTLNAPTVTLSNLTCIVPDSGDEPLRLTSPAIDLTHPVAAPATLEAHALPLNWIFGWARLLSQRIPSEPAVAGTVDATIAHNSVSSTATPTSTSTSSASPHRAASEHRVAQALLQSLSQTPWSGNIAVTIPLVPHSPNGRALPSNSAKTKPATQTFAATLSTTVTNDWQLTLPSTPLDLGPKAQLHLSAQASSTGYSFNVTGDASPAQLAEIMHALPQLADNANIPTTKSIADALRPIALVCSRTWNSDQTCATPAPARPSHPVRHRRR